MQGCRFWLDDRRYAVEPELQRTAPPSLAVEDYESMVETLEILSDPKAVAEIRQAESQMGDGEVYTEADVRAALGARRR